MWLFHVCRRKDPQTLYTDLGNYVRERRQDLELSQEQLAERVGGAYSQSDISRLERGQIELPRLGTISRLAAALEVPVGNLLIASGWFDEGHFAAMPTVVQAVEQDTLETVLSEIEAELDTIQHLEHEAKTRADRLRAMIRELQATSGVAVSMAEHESGG